MGGKGVVQSNWLAREGVAEFAPGMGDILDGKFGVLIALDVAMLTFETLGKNALLPTQRRICAERFVMIRRVLNRPHLRRLRAELDAFRAQEPHP